MSDEKTIETPKEEHPVVDMTTPVASKVVAKAVSKADAKIKTKRKPYKPRQTKIHGGYVEEAKRSYAPVKYCMNETTLAFTSAVLVVVLVSAYFIGDYAGAAKMAPITNELSLRLANANALYENASLSLKTESIIKGECVNDLQLFNQQAYQRLCQPMSEKNGTYVTITAACSATENATWARVR